MRTSAFARSDTTLQLAWVLGGFVGIALPLNPTVGLAVASVTLVAWVVLVLVSSPNRKRRTVSDDGGCATADTDRNVRPAARPRASSSSASARSSLATGADVRRSGCRSWR